MKYLLLSALICVGSSVAQAESVSWNAIKQNRKGVEALQGQDMPAAQEAFSNALRSAPFAPELHYNLGLTWIGLGKLEPGLKSYNSTLEMTQDPEIRFRTLFNLGEVAQREKKVDEALGWYQKALQEKPNSTETKVNIELLIQQQQQQSGGGGDKSQDDKDNKDKKDKGDSKDQPKEGDQDQNKDGSDKGKNYKPQGKSQPKQFKSEELSQSDVNKILGEIKRQEQKIRAEYNKREVKEQPRDKDW